MDRVERIETAGTAALILMCLVPAALQATVSDPDLGIPLLIDGEKLKFEIRYGSIPAGHAWLEVTSQDGGDGGVYRITSVARSNSIVSLFFPVNDVVVSELDAATFEPRRFEKHLREGPFEKDEQAIYERGGVVRSGGKSFEVEPGTRDILSALYYVRGQDLRVGEDLKFNTFDGGKCYEARVKVLRKEKVSTGWGDYDCVVVEPEIREGIFSKTGKIALWLTDDHLRLPVLMKSKVKVGSFVARLVGSTHSGS